METLLALEVEPFSLYHVKEHSLDCDEKPQKDFKDKTVMESCDELG